MVISDYALAKFEEKVIPSAPTSQRDFLRKWLNVARHTMNSRNMVAVLFHRQIQERAREHFERSFEDDVANWDEQCEIVHGHRQYGTEICDLIVGYKGGSTNRLFAELQWFMPLLNCKHAAKTCWRATRQFCRRTWDNLKHCYRVWRDPAMQFGPGFSNV
jgi:hypothetical protein